MKRRIFLFLAGIAWVFTASSAWAAIGTTTTINSDTPDPSVVGQAIYVEFQVAPNSSTGGVSVDGTITVSDGTGATC